MKEAGIDGHSAATLANLALEKMGLAIRVSESEGEAHLCDNEAEQATALFKWPH